MPVRSRSVFSRLATHVLASREAIRMPSSSAEKPERITPPPLSEAGASSLIAWAMSDDTSSHGSSSDSSAESESASSPPARAFHRLCAVRARLPTRGESPPGRAAWRAPAITRVVWRSRSGIALSAAAPIRAPAYLARTPPRAPAASRSAARSSSGWLSHARNSRAPIGVRVASSTPRSEPCAAACGRESSR